MGNTTRSVPGRITVLRFKRRQANRHNTPGMNKTAVCLVARAKQKKSAASIQLAFLSVLHAFAIKVKVRRLNAQKGTSVINEFVKQMKNGLQAKHKEKSPAFHRFSPISRPRRYIEKQVNKPNATTTILKTAYDLPKIAQTGNETTIKVSANGAQLGKTKRPLWKNDCTAFPKTYSSLIGKRSNGCRHNVLIKMVSKASARGINGSTLFSTLFLHWLPDRCRNNGLPQSQSLRDICISIWLSMLPRNSRNAMDLL